MEPPAPILYCRCAYANVVPRDVKDQVLQELNQGDRAFDAVADLCEMSAKRDPALGQLAKQPNLKIVACYPRAVKWLFAAARSPLPREGIEILNMRTSSARQIMAAINDQTSSQSEGDE